MSSIAYHHNKKTDTTYVYSVHHYWDKEKKASRNKQVCLGKLDKATGEIIPSKRKKKIAERAVEAPGITATTRVIGPSLILDRLAADTGLEEIVKRAFPNLHDEIMSLVYFIVQKGLPLSRCEAWSQSHIHPFGEGFGSQRVSELLREISEADRQRFLSLWLGKLTEHDYLCYDITSVSSYAEANEYVRYGYNRDGESLPQVNLAMLFGQKSHLPAFYRRTQGNISDVATLKTTVKALDFIGAHGMHFVMDRGFYSQTNVEELLEQRYHFTMAVPTTRKWVEAILDQHVDSILSPTNYLRINDKEALYVASTLHKWGEKRRRTYLHVYYNAARAAEEVDQFTRRLLQCRQELNENKRSEANEEFYARFFTIRETPKRGRRVVFNDEEIQKYRKRYAGFFCILSTQIKDSREALRVYRSKDSVEKCFDDMKNQLDMKRLRVHDSGAMDNRFFIQFLALVLICRARDVIQSDQALWNLTFREMFEAMETLVRITYSGRYGKLYTERSPLQRKIMDGFRAQMQGKRIKNQVPYCDIVSNVVNIGLFHESHRSGLHGFREHKHSRAF